MSPRIVRRAISFNEETITTMPRRKQAEKIRLTVKGEPSAATLPAEFGLSLPCMKEIRKRIGGSVMAVEGKLIWCPNSTWIPEVD